MNVAWMLPVPVLLPLLSAGLALLLGRRPLAQRVIALLALTTTTIVSIVIAIAADSGPVVLDVGSWAAPIGITLVADRLAATMLVISQIVTLAVLVYSLAQTIVDTDAGLPIAIYFPTFLVLSAGVSNAFITGDLFNLFVGFEILLAASFVLITLGGTRGRIRAGTVYVVVSLVSSAIFLGGIGLVYAATGTINMADLSRRLPEIDPGVTQLLMVVLMVAFGIKAAVFPLQAWLPDSYPTAPAPVTAVFAGLMTKVGIYALIRLQVIFPTSDAMGTVLTFVGLATMIVGILGAVAQDDIKRLLSFTLVSHIGFMIWGLALTSSMGMAAAIYYAAHHILVQTSLFLIAGLIERRTGTTSLARLHGLARTAPVISVLFLVAGMNLIGIPPLTGFIGKVALAQSAVDVGTWQAWALLAGGMATSFLTLFVVVKWWTMAFWQKKEDRPPLVNVRTSGDGRWGAGTMERQLQRAEAILKPTLKRAEDLRKASRTKTELKGGRNTTIMTATVAALVAVQVVAAAASGPLWDYVSAAEKDLKFRDRYVTAVLGEEGRGTGISNDESGGQSTVQPNPNPTASPLPSPSSVSEVDVTPSLAPEVPVFRFPRETGEGRLLIEQFTGEDHNYATPPPATVPPSPSSTPAGGAESGGGR